MTTKSNQSKKSAQKVYRNVCAFQALPMAEQLKKWNEHTAQKAPKSTQKDMKDIIREYEENQSQD